MMIDIYFDDSVACHLVTIVVGLNSELHDFWRSHRFHNT